MDNNIILMEDSYKLSHHKQYPPGTTQIYSYLESRGGMFSDTVFFGLQYLLKHYLEGVQVTSQRIAAARKLCDAHMGPGLFNYEGWEYIRAFRGGRLPVVIQAVAEGTVVPTGNVFMTIENTDPKCWWLTNVLETLLLKVWYPTTVATLSREIKKNILEMLVETGDPSQIPFKLHDFGYRGAASEESARIGGAAHLVNFQGTDTLGAIVLLQDFYFADMPAFSIPASEHSTITSWGKESESLAYSNMLAQYPTGIVACVSDSYDIFNACERIWGEQLRDAVNARQGTLVIRPDSGDPVPTILKVLEILADKFGVEVNGKGYKVLSPKVRVIQGDGVNYHSIASILISMKARGWSADNIAFGMGGALLQQVNRDTQKFAIKASNAVVFGKDRDVSKNPVGDSGKRSKAGRLALHSIDGTFSTTRQVPGVEDPYDLLRVVFEDGTVYNASSLDEIRKRAEITVSEAVGA